MLHVRQDMVLWHISRTYITAATEAPYFSNSVHHIHDLSAPTSHSCCSSTWQAWHQSEVRTCLIFPVTCSRGRWGLFANRHWHVNLLIQQPAAFFPTDIKFLNHHGMINTHLCSHNPQPQSICDDGRLLHLQKKTHTVWAIAFHFFHFMVICKANWCVFWKPSSTTGRIILGPKMKNTSFCSCSLEDANKRMEAIKL